MQLNSLLDSLPFKLTIQASLVGVISFFVFKLYKKHVRAKKLATYPKDVVILHQFRRGIRAPSISPFPIKLETW